MLSSFITIQPGKVQSRLDTQNSSSDHCALGRHRLFVYTSSAANRETLTTAETAWEVSGEQKLAMEQQEAAWRGRCTAVLALRFCSAEWNMDVKSLKNLFGTWCLGSVNVNEITVRCNCGIKITFWFGFRNISLSSHIQMMIIIIHSLILQWLSTNISFRYIFSIGCNAIWQLIKENVR